jgi:hypothetical protein
MFFKRRRKLRMAMLAALVAAAALVISGCHWARVTNTPLGVSTMIKPQNTADIIWACTSQHPSNTTARAMCALDVVWLSCNTHPINGFGRADCRYATEHYDDMVYSMRSAIQHVLGPDDCLEFWFDRWNGANDGWYSRPLGQGYPGAVCEF